MATLTELCDSGVIDTIDPLEPGELPWRTLYGTIDFLGWLDEGLPNLDHNPLYAELIPSEQVFALFAEYVSGDDFFSDRRFKKLHWRPDRYVWEFKTEEVRIFGWSPHKNAFVCCFGDSKDNIVRDDSYGRYIALTVYVRNNIDLNEPKCVTGRSYADVISNKT
tara:strand:+ start:3809 stop:4300 length:492 start_codon:yes stop_codon:yes gene_type:complete